MLLDFQGLVVDVNVGKAAQGDHSARLLDEVILGGLMLCSEYKVKIVDRITQVGPE